MLPPLDEHEVHVGTPSDRYLSMNKHGKCTPIHREWVRIHRYTEHARDTNVNAVRPPLSPRVEVPLTLPGPEVQTSICDRHADRSPHEGRLGVRHAASPRTAHATTRGGAQISGMDARGMMDGEALTSRFILQMRPRVEQVKASISDSSNGPLMGQGCQPPYGTYSGPSSVCLQFKLSGTILSSAISMSH